MIAPKVLHLAFQLEDGSNIPFIAGQFLTLHIAGPSKTIHRSYSIANAPNQNTIEIACALVEGGIASTLLRNLQIGDPIDAVGPYGLFVLKKEERPARYVLIATGTGVTPYRSMLSELEYRFQSAHPELEVVLVLGVRNRSELLFSNEFRAFSEKNNRFKFYACYSQEILDNLTFWERRGHVQTILPELKLDPQKDIVYLCGNPNMIDDTFGLLTNMGFDKKSVRREKYVFSH